MNSVNGTSKRSCIGRLGDLGGAFFRVEEQRSILVIPPFAKSRQMKIYLTKTIRQDSFDPTLLRVWQRANERMAEEKSACNLAMLLKPGPPLDRNARNRRHPRRRERPVHARPRSRCPRRIHGTRRSASPASTSSPMAGPPSAPGTAMSGSSPASTTSSSKVRWKRFAAGPAPAARAEDHQRRHLHRRPRSDHQAARSQRRRRSRLLRELQQRRRPDAAAPRVRHGPADRQGRQLLLSAAPAITSSRSAATIAHLQAVAGRQEAREVRPRLP